MPLLKALMQDQPLLISSLIKYAAEYHGQREIITRSADNQIHRASYMGVYQRIKRLANALNEFGVQQGDRIGTMAWNSCRHLEIYYAVSGIGCVCHTVNPRLFVDQLVFIMNHAEDKILFVDLQFVKLLEQVAPHLSEVRAMIIMCTAAEMPETNLDNIFCYESFIEGQKDEYEWPIFDENTASSLCYTSGTTGNPKGVLYSHRSTVLHSWSACSADTLSIGNKDNLLVIVPMFHVNAWGVQKWCSRDLIWTESP